MSEPDPLRIALVGLTHPFRGGISHYSTLLCRALRQRHDVRFFSLSRQYPELLFPGKTQIDESDSPFQEENEPALDSINPFSWLACGWKIRRWRPHLVLFNWWHPFFAPAFGTAARVAGWFGGARICYLCHNAMPHESSFVDRFLLRYAYASSDSFIAHSAQDQADLQRMRRGAEVHRNPHPTYEIFGGAAELSDEEARRKLGLEGKKVLLFFGFVRKYKGLDYLLQALDRLDDDYHLIVVGEFYDERSHYEPLIDRLQEQERVTLVDRYVPNEEVPLYFKAADLVMVPYLTATQSGVIQTAYGFLKPVVATTVGGLPEVVAEGRSGYLVPPRDAGALADAARRYFGTAGERQRFRDGIAEENRKYSWDRMVETIETVCRPA